MRAHENRSKTTRRHASPRVRDLPDPKRHRQVRARVPQPRPARSTRRRRRSTSGTPHWSVSTTGRPDAPASRTTIDIASLRDGITTNSHAARASCLSAPSRKPTKWTLSFTADRETACRNASSRPSSGPAKTRCQLPRSARRFVNADKSKSGPLIGARRPRNRQNGASPNPYRCRNATAWPACNTGGTAFGISTTRSGWTP